MTLHWELFDAAYRERIVIMVLAAAVRAHLQKRVLSHRNRTIVFG